MNVQPTVHGTTAALPEILVALTRPVKRALNRGSLVLSPLLQLSSVEMCRYGNLLTAVRN
jgi:hypothetical protein